MAIQALNRHGIEAAIYFAAELDRPENEDAEAWLAGNLGARHPNRHTPLRGTSMKEITITLPDKEAGTFVANLMDMNVTFTVRTTVAADPIVFAALEAPKMEAPPTRNTYKIQRRSFDGRSAMDVVKERVASFKGRRFRLREVTSLRKSTGFTEGTLQVQLQILTAQGKLVKVSKSVWQAVPEEAPPPPPAMELEANPAEFVNGEGWREPVEEIVQ